MTAFVQNLLANTPTFVGFIVLYYMIRNLETKMNQGFKNVENEFKLVRSELKEAINGLRSETEKGFMKLSFRDDHHDREIKRKLKHQKPKA